MPLVEVVDCEEADEFLDCLAPRGRLFRGQESVGSMRYGVDAWMYRGHPDDEYMLIPSALRGPSSFAALGCGVVDANESQVKAEADTLRRFFELTDANGLPLPEDSQALRALLRDIQTEDYVRKLNSGS